VPGQAVRPCCAQTTVCARKMPSRKTEVTPIAFFYLDPGGRQTAACVADSVARRTHVGGIGSGGSSRPTDHLGYQACCAAPRPKTAMRHYAAWLPGTGQARTSGRAEGAYLLGSCWVSRAQSTQHAVGGTAYGGAKRKAGGGGPVCGRSARGFNRPTAD
jgi:hypothetical protein